MIRALTSFLLLTIGIHAHAEVVTSYVNGREVAPVTSGATMYLRGFDTCAPCRQHFSARLVERGYRIANEIESADITVTLVNGDVSVPQDGGARRLALGAGYTADIPPIPPAATPNAGQDAGAPRLGALDLDAGAVSQGVGLTGSPGGGFLIGAATSFLAGWINGSAADATRTPGVARLTVKMEGMGLRQGFSVVAAGTTPETPESLINSAFAAIALALTSGLSAPVTSTGGR